MNAATLITAAVLSWGTDGHAAPICCPTPCVGYEMRTVVCYRPEWRAEKVPCVVEHVSYRKHVTPVKTKVWAIKTFDEQVRTSYYVPVPKVVERDVPTCVMAPVTWVDPCTGCCYVSYCPQYGVQRVRCVEYDYRREERQENVRVCKWVQEDRVVDHVTWVPHVTQENSWTVRYSCVMVPYQTSVCVPVYVPCCP